MTIAIDPKYLTKELLHNSLEEDQAKGLDATSAWAIKEANENKWALSSIIWSHQDAGGHHHFTIHYSEQPIAAPIENLKMD